MAFLCRVRTCVEPMGEGVAVSVGLDDAYGAVEVNKWRRQPSSMALSRTAPLSALVASSA